MANYSLAESLTLDDVREVERWLQSHDGTLSLAEDAGPSAYQRYRRTYGFQCLDALAEYRLHSVEAAAHRVAVHCWQPRGQSARATVFLFHGLFDHAGLFLDVCEALLRVGMSVVAVDFPGHGLSEGEPAVIHSFDQYGVCVRDVVEYFATSLSGPFYAVGQSTGCAALMSYVLSLQGTRFSKLVFFAPLVRPRAYWSVALSHTLAHRFIDYVPRKFTQNSHDEVFCRFLEKGDPLQPRRISVAWVGAMRAWVKKVPMLPLSDIPLLIFQGTGDLTVDWQWNLPRIRDKFPDSQVELLPDAMHHLANESAQWRAPMLVKSCSFLI